MVADISWFVPEEDLDPFISEAFSEALDRLMISSMDELVKASGRVEALSALKPYVKASMFITIQEVRKRMNIDGNDLSALLLIWKASQSWLIPPENLVGEITERAAVETVKKCPCSDSSPDLCIFFSHFGTEALCEIVNPEFECIITHHLTNGDPQCRLVFKKKTDPISILENPGRTTQILPTLELPKDQAYIMHLRVGSSCLHAMALAYAGLHGSEEAARVLRMRAKEIGREMGKKILRASPKDWIKNRSTVELVQSLSKLIFQQGVCTEGPNNEAEKEITSCSFQTWTKEVCIQYEALIQGMLESIDPSVEFGYDRMIPAGDRTCHWVLRNGTSAHEDPVQILKARFARGEITEEEYLRSKMLLGL